MHIYCWWESQKERDEQKDQDVGGWIILRWSFERQYRVVWAGRRALVNLRVSQNVGDFLSSRTTDGHSMSKLPIMRSLLSKE
jgi:hypothetical protein